MNKNSVRIKKICRKRKELTFSFVVLSGRIESARPNYGRHWTHAASVDEQLAGRTRTFREVVLQYLTIVAGNR